MKATLLYLVMALFISPLFAQQKQTPQQKNIQNTINDIGNLFKKKKRQQPAAKAGNPATVVSGAPDNYVPPNDQTLLFGQGILSGGENCSIVLRNGVLYGWGDNSYGQSGNGKTPNNFSPGQITTDNDWKFISLAEYHTLAIKKDSTLWAWGWGNDSEMGLGTAIGTRADLPTRVGRDTDWISVSTSDGHTVAIKADGSLWIWGNNVDARLGVGATVNSTVYTPVCVGHDKDWANAVAGDTYTMAIKKDGSLWAWGVNVSGDLGTPTVYKVQQAPIRIGTDNDWVKIFAGWRGYGSFGIKKNGTLWAWGSNRSYQLGLDKSIKESDRPIQVGTGGGWVSVANVNGCTAGIRSDGSLWHWGSSSLTGTGANIPAPQRINLHGKFISISVGINHAVAMANDGSVWSWGGNYYGQLGTSSKLYPSALPSAPVVIREFPIPVITTKSKKELATIMNEETKLLFKNVRSKLSVKDKNAIARLLGFQLSRNKNQFILGADAADYPFDISVYPTDINKDGNEEIFMTYGNSYTSGLTGSSVLLFIKDGYGEWHENLGFQGTTPYLLKSGYSGYPDLLIGLPGQVYPVWRWNGKAYALASKVGDTEFKKLHPINVSDASKAYVNAAFAKH